ncbi:ABC transporter permease [Massilia consociata]|uniref:ABC transporter permease n=1 Tax=Massilia consociata TaxID=760117 RepID=A0ABV6FCB4_9BURK
MSITTSTTMNGSVRKVLAGPALTDLRRAWELLHVIAFIAASDLRARYRRSVLGPFWMTLGTAAGTLGLGLVWSELLRMERASFVPSLTCGLIMWQLLSGCILESTTTYWRQAALIRNLSMPLSMPPIQMVVKHLINFAHNLPVLLVVGLLFDVAVTPQTLLALPCLLLLTANLLWIALLLSMLGARFRDLEYVLAAAMPLLMFLSPVFYRPDYLPFNALFVWFNPFSHFIELMRYPLLGTAPPGFVVLTNALLCLAGWVGTLWLFNAKRNRIAYWI